MEINFQGFMWVEPMPDLTNYSKQLLDRLIPASQHGINEDLPPHEGKSIEKRRFEPYDPYTPNIIRNLKDKPVLLPQDKRIPTTYIQGTEPENARGGDVWINV